MNRVRGRIAAILLALSILVPARSNGADLAIVVSVLPQSYFARRVTGDHSDVSVLIPPGANPHTFEPSPLSMRRFRKAQIYIKVGHPNFVFEQRWLKRLLTLNPGIKIVDFSDGVPALPGDPHVWLSVSGARIQARNIAAAAWAIDPAHRSDYESNLEAFLADIDELDRKIKSLLSGVTRRRFLVFHPAWEYFARDYGLEQVAVETGGHEPSPAGLAKMIKEFKREQPKAIFVQPQFSSKSARVIAKEVGCRVIEIDPLAYDWLDNLESVAETLSKVLAE